MFPKSAPVRSERIAAVFAVSLMAACWVAFAVPSEAQRLYARNYGIHDGLPSPQVRAVSQGADGRLWIAGPAGVAVYDGMSWQEFGLSAGLQWGDQTALVWDDSGRLVAVSHQAPYPASRLRGDRWRQLERPPEAAQDAVLFDVATSPEGALVYATDRGLFLGRPSGWKRLGIEGGLVTPQVRSLAVWRGGLALATDHGVFHLVDGGLTALIPLESLPGLRILALAVEELVPASSDSGTVLHERAGDRLWLVGEGWIGSWVETPNDAPHLESFATDLSFAAVAPRQSPLDMATGAEGAGPAEANPRPVRAVADGLGGLYVCGVEATAEWIDLRTRETGLVYFHPQMGIQPLGTAEGVETGGVAALFRDREDNVWLGGERGLTKIVSRRFQVWDRRVGLLDDAVYSAAQRRDGSVVLGHRGGVSVLRHHDGHATVDTRSLPLSSPDQRRIEPVRDLLEDDDGVLWIAAESAGVLMLPTLSSDPRRYAPGDGRAGGGFEGNATALAGEGRRIWIGTDRGVYLSAEGRGSGRRRFVSLSADVSDGPIHVRQMEADGDAVMVAASEGLYRIQAPAGSSPGPSQTGSSRRDGPRGGRQWHCAAGGACNSVFGLLQRSEYEWWIGTAAGVFRVDLRGGSEDFVRVELGGLDSVQEPIFFLLESAERDAVWLGTGNGVLRLARVSSSAPGSEDAAWAVQHLSVEDGLAGRVTNRAAAFHAQDGGLWMGTDGGISVYDRRFDRPTRQAPVVQLLSVEVGGEIYDPSRELRLSADDNDLVFRFRAISLIDEDRVLLRRKLEGEEDWSEPFQYGGELRYPNLRSGSYQLHLQAAGAAGNWSEPTMSAPIVVRAPFWSTPWFLVALTLTAGCLTWGLVTLVSQRRYFQRLRREVAERTSELQASEDRYRKTFKAIDDGVVATDGEGHVQLLNPTAQRLTGWSEDEARGKPVEDVMNVYYSRASDLSSPRRSPRTGPGGGGRGLSRSLEDAVKEGRGSKDESAESADHAVPKGERISLLGEDFTDTIGPTHTAVMESRDGKRRHIEMSTSPIASRAQGVTGLVFAFRDVTRRRRIEEELSRTQKLEAVGILAGGIAHDFNNLLTVLMGNLSLIHDSIRLDPDTAKALADAETALVRARDLTQQLLTFSRGGAPVRETASVSEVLRDSASFVLRGSKVRFDLDLAPGLWLVDIDAGQISQVMQNLLLNADQAMPTGGTVYIAARNVDQVPGSLGGRGRAASGHFVRIDVRDDGHGIPADLQMRIFDPYFSTKEEGRGLGLASAYAIVNKHDGLLTVRSSPGRGTTFSIYLPGSPHGIREGSERDPSGPVPTGGLPQFEGCRVLLMDDDRVVRRTAGAMLERLGCQVTHAENGAKALALYEEALDDGRRFDAVLMDLTVPGGMGGQEAVVRLRALDENAVAVVYSGYSTDPVLAQYNDYGFDGRLSKPFRIRELAAVLEEVLRPSKASKHAVAE